MKYPYIQFRNRFLPIIPIRFRIGNNDWIEFKAYVDSGAGYSVFHESVIEILGLELEEGHKEYVAVGDGSLIPVYMHRIVVQLALEEFEAMIGFSKHLGIGFNIIGRRDIFERFKVCFMENARVVEFIRDAGQ